MRGSLARKAAISAVLTVALLLSPVALLGAHAATVPWTRIATGGVANNNNKLGLPSEVYQGKLMMGTFYIPIILPHAGEVSLYSYNGSSFQHIPTSGFNDHANIVALGPTTSYKGWLYIGTQNNDTGGELYRWNGSGNPVLVPDSAGGWGEGLDNWGVVPLGEINGKLLVCVGNDATGLRMYSYDGSSWTRVVGAGTPYASGFGNPNNELAIMLIGESVIYKNEMIFTIENSVDGLSVYRTDGTTFTKIGSPTPTGDAHHWRKDFVYGAATLSSIDNKVYLGIIEQTGGIGGEIWSWNGTQWSKVIGAGIDNVFNFGLIPLARGADLFVAAWNPVTGCKIYKRSGNSFKAISKSNLSGIGNGNVAAVLESYNGQLIAGTGNNAGYEVWSTPAKPSIDRLVPDSGPYGTTVSIQGHDFLNTRGDGKVTFNGAEPHNILSWSDTEIKAIVPPEATSGPVVVTTTLGESNPVAYTVTLSEKWYFAEGTTRNNSNDGNYEEWITLQNPNNTAAKTTLTYMLADGSTKQQKVTVSKNSRYTVNVNEFLGPDLDVSTLVESDRHILAERPMYFNYRNKWTGGHDVLGVAVPQNDWYFAEGTTRNNAIDGSYDEWLCLQNPGDTDAKVTVTYMLESGQNVIKEYNIGKTSRKTIGVNTDVGPDHDVSAFVHSDTPIVAERPMYFNYRNKWNGGHDVVGSPATDTTFYFAEGNTLENETGGSFEEWLSIQNPGETDAKVTVTYYTAQAGVQSQDVTVPASSRHTVDVKLRLGANIDTSCKLTSSTPVLVERPMYFNYHNAWDGGHDVMGCYAPKKTYYFAEGNTLSDFNTWIAVMNASDAKATVTFKYLLGDGTSKQATATVEPNQRYTRELTADVPANQDVSIVVSSENLIVVERPMYFNYHGWCTGGSDTLGYGL
jgi:hypothetical protein